MSKSILLNEKISRFNKYSFHMKKKNLWEKYFSEDLAQWQSTYLDCARPWGFSAASTQSREFLRDICIKKRDSHMQRSRGLFPALRAAATTKIWRNLSQKVSVATRFKRFPSTSRHYCLHVFLFRLVYFIWFKRAFCLHRVGLLLAISTNYFFWTWKESPEQYLVPEAISRTILQQSS